MTSLKAKGKKERGQKPTHNEEEDIAEASIMIISNCYISKMEKPLGI